MGCFNSSPKTSEPDNFESENTEPKTSVSLVDESRVLANFMKDHKEGSSKNICLEPMKKRYTLLKEDGTVVWDLNRMTTEFAGWDGNFDGLKGKVLDRDEIGMEILKALIANGTPANTLTTHGRTALQITVFSGDLEYCKELIERGADVHAKNDAGETALDLAREFNNNPRDLSEIIKYLESFR